MNLIGILSLMVACGPMSKYNIGYGSEEAVKKLSLHSLDLGVDILAEEFEKNDLMSAYSVKELISHGFLRITVKQIPFDCYGISAVACISGGTIALGFKPEFNGCVSKTAYLHELTHFLLCQKLGNSDDCDSQHLMSDWWKVADFIAASKFEEIECPLSDDNLESMFIDWRIDWKKYPEILINPKSVWVK